VEALEWVLECLLAMRETIAKIKLNEVEASMRDKRKRTTMEAKQFLKVARMGALMGIILSG